VFVVCSAFVVLLGLDSLLFCFLLSYTVVVEMTQRGERRGGEEECEVEIKGVV
jgi:hypothetical protein